MKGKINEQGRFIKPCNTCEYKDYHYNERSCSKCVDIIDIIFNTPNDKKDFKNYTPQH